MTKWEPILAAWDWEPSIVIGCGILLVGYAAALRWQFSKISGYFVTGVVLLLVDLVSPLDMLGDTYLFSAHMVQHVVLLFGVPLLLLGGLPESLARRFLAHPLPRRVEGILSRPVLAWVLGVGTLWIWHYPPLYDAALASEGLHAIEHLLFLVTATMFWWPLMAPMQELRLGGQSAFLYLYTAYAANGLLAALLIFVPTVLYQSYLHPADPLGILAVIRSQWGLTPRIDQLLGGILMWVPATVVFLGVIVATLLRWGRSPVDDSRFP